MASSQRAVNTRLGVVEPTIEGGLLDCSQLGRYCQTQCLKSGESMEAELEQQFPAWVWIRIIQAAHKTHLEPTLKLCDSARLERGPGICILTFSKGF